MRLAHQLLTVFSLLLITYCGFLWYQGFATWWAAICLFLIGFHFWLALCLSIGLVWGGMPWDLVLSYLFFSFAIYKIALFLRKFRDCNGKML